MSNVGEEVHGNLLPHTNNALHGNTHPKDIPFHRHTISCLIYLIKKTKVNASRE